MNRLKRAIFHLSLILLIVSSAFAQEKQKIPAEFFTEKWSGEIEVNNTVIADGHTNSEHKIFYKLEHITLHLPEQTLPIYNLNPSLFLKQMKHYYCKGYVTISGRMKYTHIDHDYCEECSGLGEWSHIIKPITVAATLEFSDSGTEVSFDELPPEYTVITAYPHSLLPITIINPLRLGRLHILSFDPSTIKVEHENQYTEGDNYIEKYTQKGTLYKIGIRKLVFPKDIKPNEPIKTDKKMQLEITMPSKDVIKVAQNTEAVIRSESLMEIVKGKIHGLIKKLKPKTKFDIHMPIGGYVVSARGTEFEINVEDDGSTTVIVLDGEVEFSDKENKKTVIVKKNQKSVVKPGALPTEPENIDPEKILEWWK